MTINKRKFAVFVKYSSILTEMEKAICCTIHEYVHQLTSVTIFIKVHFLPFTDHYYLQMI